MTRPFDASDESSWYFGQISRQEATELLMNEKEGGIFLVRDSSTMRGDYVLCVREDSKVSHYIINKIQQNDQVMYHIGDQTFVDLPTLIKFYTIHYLDTTPLLRPASHTVHNVIAKYDFKGNDPDDLPFKKGDILTVITKDEDQWWTAKNNQGQIGSIPVPYIQKYEGVQQQIALRETTFTNTLIADQSPDTVTKKTTILQKKLPALARVKQVRIPNAYDKTALKLEVGDIIKVTNININGQWKGELNGKVGYFPFTHVEFLDFDTDNSEE